MILQEEEELDVNERKKLKKLKAMQDSDDEDDDEGNQYKKCIYILSLIKYI